MASVTEPFPISRIAGRYLLFDVDTISHVRRNHNMCGVLIGTIPNLSQQNVFLGIPLELMPEEARVLVEQGHAYIIDDATAHRKGFMEMSREDRLKYLQAMDKENMERSIAAQKIVEDRAVKALSEKGLTPKTQDVIHVETRDMTMPQFKPNSSQPSTSKQAAGESLFDDPTPRQASISASSKNRKTHFLTPTTSHPPLSPSLDPTQPLPDVPKSYPLYRHVQSKGYYAMPGLRFGCHYSIYPGDPLRFHSHFLGTGLGWDEEFGLLDIIGGGRLANRNKKAYLIGGEDPDAKKEEAMHTYSIEWVAM